VLAERNYYFDNLKFILIFLVVLGHALEPFIDDSLILPVYTLIYAFHMPLFIFISGYFSKHIDSSAYATKIFKKLLIPYIIFETLYSLFDYWLTGDEQLTFTYFTPTWILWYLFSMIIWKVILPVVVKLKYILPISIVLAVVIGYASDAGYYASLSRSIVFFPFFLAGYFTQGHWLDKLKTRSVKVVALIVAAVIGCGMYLFAPRMNVELLYHSLPYRALGYSVWYAGIYRLASMLLAAILGLCIMAWVTKRRLPIVTSAGQHTMVVFLLHGFVIKYLIALDVPAMLDTTGSKLSLVLFALGLTLLLSSPIITAMVKPDLYRSNKKALTH